MGNPIKSDVGVAESMSDLFITRENEIEQQSITYAEESTLSAVANGKTEYQQTETTVSDYKTVLLSDAEIISTLGQEFKIVDDMIGANVKQQF